MSGLCQDSTLILHIFTCMYITKSSEKCHCDAKWLLLGLKSRHQERGEGEGSLLIKFLWRSGPSWYMQQDTRVWHLAEVGEAGQLSGSRDRAQRKHTVCRQQEKKHESAAGLTALEYCDTRGFGCSFTTWCHGNNLATRFLDCGRLSRWDTGVWDSGAPATKETM